MSALRERFDTIQPGGSERTSGSRSRVLEVLAAFLLAIPMAVGAGAPVGEREPCGDIEPTIVGSSGDDVLFGTPGPDVIIAAAGDDRIDADAGDDLVCGGPGDDEIVAGEGVDRVVAGDGDDLCVTDVDDVRPTGCERFGGVSEPPSFAGGVLEVDAVTSQSVDLSWTAASDDIGLAGYAVLQDGIEVAFDEVSNRVRISGLRPGTTYRFTVVAVDVHDNPSPAADNPSVDVRTAEAAADDRDGDGIRNELELAIGTDPDLADTDGDGAPDGLEREEGCDPLVAVTTTLAGSVVDGDDAPLAGVAVTAVAGPVRATATTGETGRYEIVDLPACVDLVVVAERTVDERVLRARREIAPVADGITDVGLRLELPPSIDAFDAFLGSPVVADVDGDGFADAIAVATDLDVVAVFAGRADGTLEPVDYVATDAAPTGVVAADLDSDGDVDLVTSHADSSTVSVLLGEGDGGFESPVSHHVDDGLADATVANVTVADATGDRLADLVVSNRSGMVWILAGDGAGSFADGRVVATMASEQVAIDDVTGDGVPDLVTTNRFTGRLVVASGAGDGGFGIAIELPTPPLAEFVLAEFTGDGRVDAIAAGDGGLRLLAGAGGGGFSTAVPLVGTSSGPFAIVDRDGDGSPDIVQVGVDGLVEHLTDGEGVVVATATVPADLAMERPAIGDVDGDGLADVVAIGAERLEPMVFATGAG